MLRSPQIRRKVPQSFICWKCSAKLHAGYPKGWQSNVLQPRWAPLSRPEGHAWGQGLMIKHEKRSFNVGPISYASTEALVHETFTHDLPLSENQPTYYDTRQRLREWESENAPSYTSLGLPDTAAPGEISNDKTRQNDGDFRIESDIDETDDYEHQSAFGLLDVGNRRSFLLPGDLVELRSIAGQQQELAIFVRELEDQCQFYTMSGRYIHRTSKSAHFFVPHFVDPEDLDEILPFLPNTDVSKSLRDRLHNFPQSVPRDLGKALVRKMLTFWAESDTAYQAAAFKLDNAHDYVAHPDKFTYATLEQIAEKVLPKTVPKREDGKFPNHVLYAVHRSLLRNDIGFRTPSKGTLRTGGQYEINSRQEVNNVAVVSRYVRRYREQEVSKMAGERDASPTQLESFAKTARHLVDLSRKTRQYTPHGTIGPYTNKRQHEQGLKFGLQEDVFEPHDRSFIRFLESWAALTSFELQSTLNGIGSEILRAIGRYEEVDLGPSTAWTFLQEIGVIAPWENRLAFDLRLPGVGRRLKKSESDYPPIKEAEDRLQHLRKDWGHLPIYCIDDPRAHEIDDGISVEATGIPDEYWVHIHTADPAAFVEPHSAAATYAESITETVYTPDRVWTMFDPSFVRARLSLAPDRPCMTFSARMNKRGELLETQITPGIARDVLYLSPSVMKQVEMGPSWASTAKETVRVVGQHMPDISPTRPMLEYEEISDAHKDNLRLLAKLGEAHTEQRWANGGIDRGYPLKPNLMVSMSPELCERSKGKDSIHYKDDPTIRVSTEDQGASSDILPQSQTNTVQSLMLLAGQIVARWCSDRGIPIPYRVTPRNPDKENPSDFFLKRVLPSRKENGVTPNEINLEYLGLFGGVLPSTTPGPHLAIGVDMMAKCTSPLRRFGDLLLHWQVGSTLLEEARLGQSLIGNTREDFLPFSKARIDALLPRLDTRERLIAYGKGASDRIWMCQFLLRSWRFKEVEIPTKLSFLVRKVELDERKLRGVLKDFLTEANCLAPDWMDIEQIQEGNTIEVELEDVDVYRRSILVKPFRSSEPSEST